MLQLRHAIRRVYVDQDQLCLGGGELHDRPFRPVRRSDGDVIARLQPKLDQVGGKLVDLIIEFGIDPADSLRDGDERITVTMLRCGLVKKGTDRKTGERRAGLAVNIAQGGQVASIGKKNLDTDF